MQRASISRCSGTSPMDTCCSTSRAAVVASCCAPALARRTVARQQATAQPCAPAFPRAGTALCAAQSRTSSSSVSTTTANQSAVRVPHCGYHWDGTPRRFFEGWYWKVQIPGTPHSFALIYSIEGPDGRSDLSGVGLQVMGPDDGYICQYTPDTECFWAERDSLALGAGMRATAQARRKTNQGGVNAGRMLSEETFFQQVEHGFQASYTQQTGRMIASEAGAAGTPFSTVSSCSWGITIKPVSGWGSNVAQKATAGWLSVFSVFEPHWQVLMAHGLASGWFEWGGQRYEFSEAPAYAEKNWGGGFPSKWAWVQCNSFDQHPGVSVTAVGARRQLVLGVPGIEEDVGMIGVHLPDGRGGETFVELVPWAGEVEWDVEPWGRWRMSAQSAEYEAALEAECEAEAGTVLRAPTANMGLAPFCRDTFAGRCRLRVWRRRAGGARGQLLLDAVSSSAALEVGGGPWWSSWSARADMKEPLRSLVQLPIDVGMLVKMVPGQLKPPGL